MTGMKLEKLKKQNDFEYYSHMDGHLGKVTVS